MGKTSTGDIPHHGEEIKHIAKLAVGGNSVRLWLISWLSFITIGNSWQSRHLKSFSCRCCAQCFRFVGICRTLKSRGRYLCSGRFCFFFLISFILSRVPKQTAGSFLSRALGVLFFADAKKTRPLISRPWHGRKNFSKTDSLSGLLFGLIQVLY